MGKLTFGHCNIHMATNESTGRTIAWDKDTDTFGSGCDLPEALHDLADNYGDEYRLAKTDWSDIDDEDLDRFRDLMENLDGE